MFLRFQFLYAIFAFEMTIVKHQALLLKSLSRCFIFPQSYFFSNYSETAASSLTPQQNSGFIAADNYNSKKSSKKVSVSA
jgi:hypothetical protein